MAIKFLSDTSALNADYILLGRSSAYNTSVANRMIQIYHGTSSGINIAGGDNDFTWVVDDTDGLKLKNGSTTIMEIGNTVHIPKDTAVGTTGPTGGTFSISNSDDSYLTIFGFDGGAYSYIDGDIVLKDYGLGNVINKSSNLKTAKYALGVSSTGKLIELPLTTGDPTTVTHSSNTHTIDFNADNQNYNVTANNAANTIAFSNLAAADVGKQGTIIITNPSSVGSLSFAALPNTAYTPGGSTITFDTTADAIAVITYMVIASNKVLVNYVGGFKQYGT
jgi:hypothetical protein|tara:strand:- start:160 stop:993 length:834 start_codon:yes stop_codon:yes gene_type:complete